jgi:hypothetical protein
MEHMRTQAERFSLRVIKNAQSRSLALRGGGVSADLKTRHLLLGAQLYGGCDKASPVARLMLHLRSRYVSKAAILTIPVQPVLVENRSPA